MDDDPGSREQEALRRVIAGETAAFREIVERYGERVLRFCRSRLGSEEDARDAAQEVFLRAYGSLRSFRLGESFAAWLFAIAANRARTRGHREALERRRTEAAGIEAAAAPRADPETEAERRLESESLRDTVRTLPVSLRRPVELYYYAELSVGETAAVLGIGEEAVKSRLFRARKILRQSLEDRQPERPGEGIER